MSYVLGIRWQFESVDNHRNRTYKLWNKRFPKLNSLSSINTCSKWLVRGVAVCTKITNAQRRLLRGGSVVTTQEHVDNLCAPAPANESGKAIATWLFEAGVAFNTLQSPAFKEMCTAVARAGRGFEQAKDKNVGKIFLKVLWKVLWTLGYSQSSNAHISMGAPGITCDTWTAQSVSRDTRTNRYQVIHACSCVLFCFMFSLPLL